MNSQGQLMSYNPARPQASHIANMKLTPGVPGTDSLCQPSRKRKATVLDKQGIGTSDDISELVNSNLRENMPYHFPLESNPLHNTDALSGENVQGNTREIVSHENIQFTEVNNKGFQYGKRQSSGASDACMKEVHSASILVDGMSFCQGNNVLSGNSSLKLLSLPSESLTPFLASQQGILDGRICIQDFSKVGPAFGFKWSDQGKDIPGAKDTWGAGKSSAQSSLCNEGKEAYESDTYPKTEVTCDSPCAMISDSGLSSGNGDQLDSMRSQMSVPAKSCGGEETYNVGHSLTGTHIEKPEPNMKNQKHSLEKPLPKIADSPTKRPHVHGNNLVHGLDNLDLKRKSHGSVATKRIEKLWDGSLQLNASVTASATAIFRSGEKVSDVNWPKVIEVKGKVRLEAFEKFIQELPRSRNRGLMVISLCWKIGSSKTGLTGMKEVAKGYGEGERVGFAQLSQGIDLYVCPRSDTIITILAKYGFFKGMAAVDDNHDSLIGCVVWRKNRKSSNSDSKISERKTSPLLVKPLDSAANPAILQVGETTSPVTTSQDSRENQGRPNVIQPAKSSSSHRSHMRPTALVVSSNMSTESKNVQFIKELGVHKNSTDGILKPVVLSPDESQVMPVMHTAEENNTHTALDGSEPILPGPSQTIPKAQQRSDSSDDDDLPEFDFGAACGISQSPVSEHVLPSSRPYFSSATLLDKTILVGEAKKTGAPMSLVVPTGGQMSVTDQQSAQASTSPWSALNIHLGKHENQVLTMPISEGKPAALGNILLGRPRNVKPSNTAEAPGAHSHITKKYIWYDDDDMPEWCPPDLECENQPLTMATTGFLRPCSSLRSLSKVPAGHAIPSQPAQHLSLYTRGFPGGSQPGLPGHSCGSNNMMPPQDRPASVVVTLGPSCPPRFSPLHLRPPSGIHIRPPPIRTQSGVFDIRSPIRPQSGIFHLRPPLRPVDQRAPWS